MFCRECGTENKNDSLFCKNCGTSLNGKSESGKVEVKKEKDNSIKHNIKPTFRWGYKILTVSMSLILLALLILLYMYAEDIILVAYVYARIIVGAIAICTVVRLVFERLQYNKLNYNFYNDRVEYLDGFLNISEKELKYKNVREVTFSQNILERMFKIGTIRIFTNARSGWGGQRNNNQYNMNGITIHCIVEPKEQYKIVKELIDSVDSNDD